MCRLLVLEELEGVAGVLGELRVRPKGEAKGRRLCGGCLSSHWEGEGDG